MKGRLSLIILLVFFSVFLFSQNTRASDVDLLINEIYPNPTSGEVEWIEIYNPTNQTIDLTNYSIEDGTHKPKALFGMLCSGCYFVIEKNPDGFSFALNNDKEIIILKYIDLIVDQVAYGNWDDGSVNPDENFQAPSQGKSLSRIPNGENSGQNKNDFRVLIPSKESENILPIFSSLIRINEIIPQPSTGSPDEFVELYNNSSQDIDISGWQLDDIDGGSSPYNIPDGTIIESGAYLVFKNQTTKISLNDSGDSVRLIDPNGDIKSIVSYEKAKRGQSYSWFFDAWKWTNLVTSGSENIFQEEIILPDEDLFIEEALISQVRELPIEETVKVIGVVSVLPGKLSSQYFYIEDESGGIQIYSYHKSFPFLRLGDVVSIVGELAEYKNERRIKISSESDIQIISSRSPPEAKKIKIDEINERLEGRYISVTGTVTKTSGNVFYIRGSGEIQVSIREGTGIKKPKMRVGDRVEIAGILSQYGDYYRILPTRQDDVKIIKSLSLAKSGMNLYLSLLITGLIFFLWNIFQKVKKRLQRLLQVL